MSTPNGRLRAIYCVHPDMSRLEEIAPTLNEKLKAIGNVPLPCLDTPFTKHYNTNYAASESDIRTISEIVAEHQAQHIEIDAIITNLQEAEKQLREKQVQLLASMKAHKHLTFCIHRLPPETLGEIFVWSLSPSTNVVDRNPPPVSMMVCRRWREIALITPRLWCSLLIPRGFYSWNDKGLGADLSFCRNWLSRAKECPLSLIVNINSSRWRNSIVVEFLQPYMRRCAFLHVRCSDEFEPVGLDSLLKGVAYIPLLQRLTLEGNIPKMKNSLASAVRSQPLLRTLMILSSCPFSIDFLPKFDPWWSNLTCLGILFGLSGPWSWNREMDDHWHMLTTLLRNCPNLEHLVLGRLQINYKNLPSITHPKLRSLIINSLGEKSWCSDRGEGRLGFPNLNHFEIANECDSSVFLDPRYSYNSADVNLKKDTQIIGTASGTTSAPQRKRRLITISEGHYHGARIMALFLRVLNREWVEVTHIKLMTPQGYVAEETLSVLFELCPNLEEFHVSSVHSFPPTSLESHLQLRSLDIAILGSIHPLKSPSLPNLRRLHLRMKNGWTHGHSEMFKKLYTETCWPLETLEIDAPGITDEQVRELPELIPTLESLVVNGQEYSWIREG